MSPKRTAEIVQEATRLNARTQAQVVSKIGVLQLYLDELHADADKYKTFARQNDIALDLGSEAEV